MKLSFFGAAGEVTGSCYRVETATARFLVDCGMFQGGRSAYIKNLEALDFDPRNLDFVLITHAHIDHSGLLPRLAVLGYRGPVYTTRATADLLNVMLRDSAHIQEKQAEWENYSRRQAKRKIRRDIAPLYTVAQAEACLKQLREVDYDAEIRPHDGIRCRFRDAGHILGSAIIELWADTPQGSRKLVFSGDLGQPGQPVVKDPTFIEEADVLLVESTYGNRLHKDMAATLDEITHAIRDTLERKRGNVIIPAFTVGRTQDIIFLLSQLVREKRLGKLDIYVDSPMALRATEITMSHRELWDEETRDMLQWQATNNRAVHVNFVEDVQESKALNAIQGGAIIISASGMCDAGRIQHHLRHNLGRKECTILIPGFQAAGTLGRRLVDGARTVRLFKEEIPVRADIYTIGGLSAHADQGDLLGWLGHFRSAPRHTFVVHGEDAVAHEFAALIRKVYHWNNVTVPEYRDSVEID
ncbi:MAG: MBL fold metallo-hydrolase [Sulfuricellaceae bacterium]|nr:MBL fold metallo-hydrolase [Sulfuricellaceae bacterium]